MKFDYFNYILKLFPFRMSNTVLHIPPKPVIISELLTRYQWTQKS